MTLDPTLWYVIPDATVRAAKRAFPKGNRYMTMYDTLGPIFTNPDFADLYPRRGHPAEAPARLALVLVFQQIEHLSDADAAEAVRARLDWKYALALEIDDPGFDSTILGDFRTRLLTAGAESRLLTIMVDTLVDAGLVRTRGRQRSDSTHVLANLRQLTRMTLVAETMRATLNALADTHPTWLAAHLAPDWAERYAVRVEEYRLPKAAADRQILETTIGQDGYALLDAVAAADTPPDLRQNPAVQLLRQIWLQQYYGPHDVRWRSEDDLPPHAQMIRSPYETEARFATKRQTTWTGYKVHLTETCDDDQPHLITNVETTPATTNDVCVTDTIHTHLAARNLLPQEHLLDSGYMAAEVLVTSQQQGVDVIGPVLGDTSWQARQPDGLDIRCFVIDWDAQQVTCPVGKRSVRWSPRTTRAGASQEVIGVQFDPDDCQDCALRARCTQAKTGPRTMKLRPRDQHETLQTARQRQVTEAFTQMYAARAGIEGCLSQGVRAFGLRASRYRGQAKTHVQHILIAIAINIVRVVAWVQGIPRATTRQSSFARLVASLG
ncbi:IS1182 family transposase [Candidatus Oscillochloris fontis]|uniref:IS1182 family transposase n=1 Tax=Candidatus Oscillochloris fontis TaxID=2496868 RepID=UPI00101C12B3|nr:IS1182 family transposase [Candidatus Oscillochloris fontis]